VIDCETTTTPENTKIPEPLVEVAQYSAIPRVCILKQSAKRLLRLPTFKLAVAPCREEWLGSPKFANSTEFSRYGHCLMMASPPVAGAPKSLSARHVRGIS